MKTTTINKITTTIEMTTRTTTETARFGRDENTRLHFHTSSYPKLPSIKENSYISDTNYLSTHVKLQI